VVLGIIATYVAFYMVLAPAFNKDAPDQYGLDQAPTIDPPSDGLFSSIGNVFSAIGSAFGLVFGAITFNVSGAPPWVQYPVAVVIIGSLVWSVVTLIRGN